PRPPNAWMLYRADKSKELTESQPEGVVILQSQISKILGQRWTQESKDVRDVYERKAKEAKREHDRMYPGYKYTP
ncbi:putative HMG box protein, partial [Trametes sanguinea]